MKNIQLLKHDSYIHNDLQVYFKGYFWHENILYNTAKSLCELIAASQLVLESEFQWKELISKFNGSFSIVFSNSDSLVLVSDVVRSFPLFYKTENGVLKVSDSVDSFSNISVDEQKLSAFILSGYSFLDHTIYNQINGIQAAEVIVFNYKSLNIDSYRYFKFVSNKNAVNIKTDVFVKRFNKQMDAVIDRMLASAPNVNNWIIPLSGGHDSRQIVNFLYKRGIKNIICFSYGKQNNIQAKLSKEIAEKLNYEWHFIEYSEKKWYELHKNGLIDQYIDFAFQGVSTPHLQDFLAIYELKQKNIIQKNDVIVPGHTLDMLAGGHFSTLDLDCQNKKNAIYRTAKRHSKLYENNLVDKSPLFNILGEIYEKVALQPVEFQEYINWQERQAKFIVNSCRVYEFFDFQFRLPFWDIEMVHFFMTISKEQRKERLFFKVCEREGILIPLLADIPFEDEMVSKPAKISIRNKITSMIPDFIKARLSKYLAKQYEAESLNQIYALKAETVEGIVGFKKQFPKSTHQFLETILPRPSYRVDYHLLSGLYAVNRILKNIK